jgi:hypothetical protein
MNQHLLDNPTKGGESINYIEEHTLRIEDKICLMYGLKPYQLKELIQKNQISNSIQAAGP